MLVALVNAAKQKFAMALAGHFVWPVGAVGALRLAKPRSPLARFLYRGEELRPSFERYPARDA